jgi:hypothetical protein
VIDGASWSNVGLDWAPSANKHLLAIGIVVKILLAFHIKKKKKQRKTTKNAMLIM